MKPFICKWCEKEILIGDEVSDGNMHYNCYWLEFKPAVLSIARREYLNAKKQV